MLELNRVQFVSVGMEIISKVRLIKSLNSKATNNNVHYVRALYTYDCTMGQLTIR